MQWLILWASKISHMARQITNWNCQTVNIETYIISKSFKRKTLTLFHMNICSLTKNFDDFNILLNEINVNFDILAIKSSINLHVDNYSILSWWNTIIITYHMVITIAQLHSTKPQLKCSTGSNPVNSVSEICDGEDLWEWSRLEIRLNASRRSTLPQKQFIVIIIIIII